MKSKLIGLAGAAGSGKSFAAQYLREHGFKVLSFATPIKKMVAVIVPDILDKKAEIPLLGGHTLRHAYQTLGTEWGRQMISDSLWCDYLVSQIVTGENTVVDDVRFDNEALRLREEGATIIKINREGSEKMNHASEHGLNPSLIDVEIDNNGTVEELYEALDEILRDGNA